MAVDGDQWVTAAMSDDTMVVELLFRLKTASTPKHSSSSAAETLFPVRWGHRRPRSKAADSRKSPARCSPTTPFSWTAAATSSSDGGSDRSSPCGSNSKAAFGIESSSAHSDKKATKRKTFSELKAEEGFLMEQRTYLDKELATMRVTLNEQKTTSENLKRIKLDLHQPSGNKMYETMDPSEWRIPAVQYNVPMPKSEPQEAVKPKLLLPDLNMMPSEEDLGF